MYVSSFINVCSVKICYLFVLILSMPSSCVVPYCTSKLGGHKFPKDRIIREKWIAAIRRVNFMPSEYSIVCKKHFRKEDYRLPKESVRNNPTLLLKKDAVPSKFLWSGVSQRKLLSSQRCSVLQCRSGSSKNVILHSCPNQEAVRKKWAEVFKVNREIVKNMLICSHHFLKSDYLRSKNGDSKTLKQNAVPSQKLPRSTRVIPLFRNMTHTKKKIIKPKNVKKEEKMTEVVVNNEEPEQKKDIRECRACLKPMEAKASMCNIFQAWAIPWIGMESTIAEDLGKLANVQVMEADNFPKVICEPCYQKLLEASTFAAKVRISDQILRQRIPEETENSEKVWPKPIQVDKNINGNVFQEMDIEIKQEVVSDEEYDPSPMENSYIPDNSYMENELNDMEIKIEPEEIVEQPPLTITINGTMSLNPSDPENKTILNGSQDYEAIITDGTEHKSLTNGTDHIENEQFPDVSIKEEPPSEEEDPEHIPDLSLECMLCTKLFNSVTGLKAHVIAQHSYKSVKRKSGGAVSPEKRQKDEHRCEICKRSFITSTDLMVHETCHNKHSCYACSRKFDTFKQLSKHRKRCQAPLNKTALKPKTLDDVIRPVKDENMDTSEVASPETYLQDSNDSGMKLLDTHSLKSETHSVQSETEAIEGSGYTNMEILSGDCT